MLLEKRWASQGSGAEGAAGGQRGVVRGDWTGVLESRGRVSAL